jgi:cysteinyl-tRNA synthetase
MGDKGLKPGLDANFLALARDNFRHFGSILGLFQCTPKDYFEGQRRRELRRLSIDEDHINRMIQERHEARRQRDWKGADQIRESLASMGITLEDGPDGTTWRLK